MILVRDLLTALGLDLKFSDNVIIGGEGPYEGCLVPMVDLSNYDLKYITVKTEEYFINLYVKECLESKSAISSTFRMSRILGAKYEKDDLNTVMTKQCHYLNAAERYRLLTF